MINAEYPVLLTGGMTPDVGLLSTLKEAIQGKGWPAGSAATAMEFTPDPWAPPSWAGTDILNFTESGRTMDVIATTRLNSSRSEAV